MTIRESIIEAMKQTCAESVEFQGETGSRLDAEYLLTVNIAKAISNGNFAKGNPHVIRLEQCSREFSWHCLPLLRRKNLSGTVRPGRIDVAVYAGEDLNKRYRFPICPIEVKGFDPGKSLVMSDLKRNVSYFHLAGGAGRSELELAYFCSLHSYKKTDPKFYSRARKKVRERFEGYIPQIGPHTGVDIGVESLDISSNALGEIIDEGDYEVVKTATKHHFVGIVVEFRRTEV